MCLFFKMHQLLSEKKYVYDSYTMNCTKVGEELRGKNFASKIQVFASSSVACT